MKLASANYRLKKITPKPSAAHHKIRRKNIKNIFLPTKNRANPQVPVKNIDGDNWQIKSWRITKRINV
ncbi:hypothetical protein [Shewanella halifaxensis]|nr:hypothetical protein [Shewanella halifaxensis]